MSVGSVNKVTLVGHLVRDPEVRRTKAGQPVVVLAVVTTDRWCDPVSGEKHERDQTHRVVIYHAMICEYVEKRLRAGALLLLEGELRTRKWKSGQSGESWTCEVVLQGHKGQLVVTASFATRFTIVMIGFLPR